MLVRRLAAVAAIAFLTLLGPATAAFAADPVSAPYVSATADSDHTVRLDWYLDDDAPLIEIASTDSTGASAVDLVESSAGFAIFTDLPGGTWQADVTAVSGSERSETVSVVAQVLAPAPVPTPVETPATPVTSTAATIDLAVVPGEDGTIHDSSVRVTATRLGAGTSAALTLDGAPLGTLIVGPDGAVDQTIALPAALAAGSHRLDFAGVDEVGTSVTSTYSFEVAAPVVAPVPADDGGEGGSILDISGDEAVPYLVAGTVAATVVSGAAAVAASTMTTRVRAVRVARLIEAEFSGTGGVTSGRPSFLGDLLTSLRGPR